MAIRIELSPDEEAQLRERASARGTALEVLAVELLRANLLPQASVAAKGVLPVFDESGVFHPERLEAVLQRCAELSAGPPYLPREALTRESLYIEEFR